MLKTCRVFGVAVLFLAGSVLFQRAARADTAQLTLTGTPTGYSMGGVYTSPYSFTVTPTGGKPFTTDLICDDFTTDISFGDSWSTNVYTLADVTGTGNMVPEVGQSVATAQQEAICRIAQQIVGLMEKPW